MEQFCTVLTHRELPNCFPHCRVGARTVVVLPPPLCSPQTHWIFVFAFGFVMEAHLKRLELCFHAGSEVQSRRFFPLGKVC